jgi:hypothetical protein
MKVAATWAPYIATAFGLLLINPLVLRANVGVDPELKSQYKSAIVKFDEEYRHALSAASGLSTPDLSINGREGMALAMFYLGWASHLVQDQTVVHHTFDSVDHHGEYEAAADLDSPDRDPVLANLIETPLRANGQQMGLYDNQVSERLSELNKPSCEATGRNCFASYAAYVSHDEAVLDAAQKGNYTNVRNAIPLAQNLQAGLYASFLTDIGLPPVHMSAVMAAL